MATISAHDVANYILSRRSPLSVMKLQKLLYYSQAWSLVFEEEPLFRERIEAWAYGPVVPDVYAVHRGAFSVATWPNGNPAALSAAQQDTVELVLNFYGDKSAQWLSDLTHGEAPWQDARRGLGPTDRGSREITHVAMAEYYSSLPESPE